MRWLNVFVILPLIIASSLAEWSWNEDDTREKALEKTGDLLQGEELPKALENVQANHTILDSDTDKIASRHGKSLDSFDEYADPNVKDDLDSGADVEGRHLIKERLCELGLMECENHEDVQEKRQFVSPDELIYAQPVDIKPIGKPIASIPVRGPPRAYGAPKPMPYPSKYHKSPPKRNSYGGPVRPGFSEKYGQVSNFQFGQNNGPHSGLQESSYLSRPSPTYAGDNPYTFDNIKQGVYNKPPSIPLTQSSPNSETIVQQHVHHHYVHEDKDKEPKVIIKPVAIPVGSVGSLHAQHHQVPDIITAGDADFGSYSSGGFKPMTGGYTNDIKKPVYESETVYGTQYQQFDFNKGSNNINNQGPSNSFGNNGFIEQGYGNSLGSYSNKDFYKKELNLASINNQGPQVYDVNQEPKGFECICINYEQCENELNIGKRDDLYLPIDPRNKGSSIDAYADDDATNITIAATTDNKQTESNSTNSFEDIKKITKRDVESENKDEASKQIEPRLIGLAGYGGNGGNGGNSNKQVQPTFGVSFGLPQSSSGYPINPYNSNPLYNPYGPALNGGGINLGLISVNPLLSVQVTKNDYGEKVVKPFVNLHVTPNEHVVHKLGHLFHEKKHYLLNKHEHYHNHNPYLHHPSHHISHHNPHEYVPIHAPIHTPHYGHSPPVYSPHHTYYDPALHSGVYHNKYKLNEAHASDNDDYYDDDDNGYNNEPVDYSNYNNGFYDGLGRSANNSKNENSYAKRYGYARSLTLPSRNPGATRGGTSIRFPSNRKKRETESPNSKSEILLERKGYYKPQIYQEECRPNQVCCRRLMKPRAANHGQCGIRHSQGINGRIKTPSYVDGDSEFGEYPWQAAILKKDPKESVYACGGTLIDNLHIITAAHCIKSYKAFDLRVRLGEWDVNHDVEFYPYIERNVVAINIHPQYYAGTLDNDLAILKLDVPLEFNKYPHISPACLPDKYTNYAEQRCWTTGWGKDAFGDHGKYQNILKEVDVPILGHAQCQQQLRQTRLGYNYELNPGFLCAGGEEGKDACKGDGGGPLVCERGGTWQVVGVVSWGIGCGQPGVPGVYVKVAHYLDWISQVTRQFSNYN